jgi:hypothetical protein
MNKEVLFKIRFENELRSSFPCVLKTNKKPVIVEKKRIDLVKEGLLHMKYIVNIKNIENASIENGIQDFFSDIVTISTEYYSEPIFRVVSMRNINQYSSPEKIANDIFCYVEKLLIQAKSNKIEANLYETQKQKIKQYQNIVDLLGNVENTLKLWNEYEKEYMEAEFKPVSVSDFDFKYKKLFTVFVNSFDEVKKGKKLIQLEEMTYCSQRLIENYLGDTYFVVAKFSGENHSKEIATLYNHSEEKLELAYNDENCCVFFSKKEALAYVRELTDNNHLFSF